MNHARDWCKSGVVTVTDTWQWCTAFALIAPPVWTVTLYAIACMVMQWTGNHLDR